MFNFVLLYQLLLFIEHLMNHDVDLSNLMDLNCMYLNS